jgi:acyl-CoA hydrolase
MRASKYADETEIRTTHWMMPEMANPMGNIFGGQIMALVDTIAYMCAARYAANRVCVTAAMDRLDLHEPVHVGELLNLIARVTYAGRSSMEVEVNVYAENLETSQLRLTHTCYLTMVSLKDSTSAEVPRLVCRTSVDKARYLQTRMRREMGMRYRQERDRFVDEFALIDDTRLDALVAADCAQE